MKKTSGTSTQIAEDGRFFKESLSGVCGSERMSCECYTPSAQIEVT
jgi:hypothetical protein